jgi:hypothetical protein
MEGSPIPVEILHTETCGNWPLAVAQALRFPGSPTIRVRGRDLQPQAEERGDFGLG